MLAMNSKTTVIIKLMDHSSQTTSNSHSFKVINKHYNNYNYIAHIISIINEQLH